MRAHCVRIIFVILVLSEYLNKYIQAGADTSEHETIFLINVNDGQDHYCIGSYISPGWVLTTAVCATLIFEDIAYIKLTIGDPHIEARKGTHRKAGAVILRDDNDVQIKSNNIALIKLTNPYTSITHNPFIALHETKRADTEMCYMYGWFQLASNAMSKSANIIHKSKWTFFQTIECEKRLNKTGDHTQRFLEEQMECGRDDNCISDDGAPLVCGGKLYGLLSTADCAVSVVIKVAQYAHWIRRKAHLKTPSMSKVTLRSGVATLWNRLVIIIHIGLNGIFTLYRSFYL